jgi:hypothetical protein
MQRSPSSLQTTRSFRRYCLRLLCTVLALASTGTLSAPISLAQAAAMVTPTGEIPKEHYKTWSLFLVCNPAWLSAEKSKDLFSLYQQFQNFGRTIGDDHLAVWFWKDPKSPYDPNLAANVDVERSVRFCKALQLKPSQSPEIVIMANYPDESNLPKEFAAFQLGLMSPTDISGLLAKLSDQLLLTGKLDPTQTADVQGRLWIRLLSAAQRVIGDFSCAWSLKIATGLLSAELHSCQKP